MTQDDKIQETLTALYADEFNVEIIIDQLIQDPNWREALFELSYKDSQYARSHLFGEYTRDLSRKYMKRIAKDLALDSRVVAAVPHSGAGTT